MTGTHLLQFHHNASFSGTDGSVPQAPLFVASNGGLDEGAAGQAATRAFFGATVRYANAAGVERAVSIVGTDEIDLNRR